MNGIAAGNGRADAEAPVRVLIKAQHLAGERHAERHEQKKDAQDPGQLAGKFVGPEQKHLRHVDEHDGDHEVRAPAVDRAKKPAQVKLLIQNVEAAPRLPCGRHVDDGEQNAGDDLQNEKCESGAAEHVPPACRVARHRVQRRFLDGRFELETKLQPVI